MNGIEQVAAAALDEIQDGFVVGLGSGRAATQFIQALGERVKDGLRVRGVATSQTTANLAIRLGIEITTLDKIDAIDVAVDGADEVDPQLNLIKGLGGALVREKIVAAAARRLIILVGPEKLVPVLGSRGVLPVEVVPFGLAFCQRRLTQLGYPATPRKVNNRLFVSDNGNRILDCKVRPLADPRAVEQMIRAVPGIVDTGLFLGMADTVIYYDDSGVQRRKASAG